MNNETMVYYPLTDTWETVPATDGKVEPKGATAAPKPPQQQSVGDFRDQNNLPS